MRSVGKEGAHGVTASWPFFLAHSSISIRAAVKVMAIGRTWEESIQKALRMVDGGGSEGFEPRGDWSDPAKLRHELVKPTDKRIHAIAYALAHKVYSVDELHELTSIDRWFLYRLEGISETGADIEHKHRFLSALTRADLLRAKQMGFSDRQIAARLTGQAPPTPGTSRAPHVAKKVTADDVRAARKAVGVTPFVKQARKGAGVCAKFCLNRRHPMHSHLPSQIDTLAAEYPAETNYLYTTYHGSEHDVDFSDKGIMVLGSGAYRIGSSVEFDWCVRVFTYVRLC